MKYAIRYGAEAKREYRNEFKWSVRQWGKTHASDFFAQVRGKITSLTEFPLAYPKPIGAKGDYRVVNLSGLRVAYHINERHALVTILAIVGRNHYHELEEEVMQALKNLHE